MKASTILNRFKNDIERIPELGERHTLCNWFRSNDNEPLIDMHRYGHLLTLLPDHIVENMEKARLAQDGRIPMITAGLGYQEVLGTVIVDGTPITSSSTEAFLFPAQLLPPNYLQPGGIPGRHLRLTARGRNTTLSTAGTMTFKLGAAVTNAIPTTTWAASGAIVQDAAVHTAEMWSVVLDAVVRSVGSGGTIFAEGEADMSSQAFTIAQRTNDYMGSAGSATPAAASVDQTISQFMSLTGKWSLTTAYSITGHIFCVESLN